MLLALSLRWLYSCRHGPTDLPRPALWLILMYTFTFSMYLFGVPFFPLLYFSLTSNGRLFIDASDDFSSASLIFPSLAFLHLLPASVPFLLCTHLVLVLFYPLLSMLLCCSLVVFFDVVQVLPECAGVSSGGGAYSMSSQCLAKSASSSMLHSSNANLTGSALYSF